MEKFADKIKSFFFSLLDRRLEVYASSGCYFMFMSLVPTVMIACCLLPYTPFTPTMILGYLSDYLTPALYDVVKRIVNGVYASNAATLTVSILIAVYAASGAMRALMKGMDAAYGKRRQENVLIFNVKAIVYMILLLVALLASLIALVYGRKVIALISEWIPGIRIYGIDSAVNVGRYAVMILILMLFFTLFYVLLPAGKRRPLQQLPGAFLSALIWVGFSELFARYVEISGRFGTYGFIGTTMVAMLWMYFCFFFLLFGGFVNNVLIEKAGGKRLSGTEEKEEI